MLIPQELQLSPFLLFLFWETTYPLNRKLKTELQ